MMMMTVVVAVLVDQQLPAHPLVVVDLSPALFLLLLGAMVVQAVTVEMSASTHWLQSRSSPTETHPRVLRFKALAVVAATPARSSLKAQQQPRPILPSISGLPHPLEEKVVVAAVPEL